MNSKQRFGHPFVKQHGQYGYGGTLDDVQRGHAEYHEGGHIVDAAVDFGTHGDDGVQRQAEELGELGQQIDRIEGSAQNGHGQGAENQTDDGAVTALVGMIPDGGGQHEAAANHEIGKVTHKGGGGTLYQQF